MVIIVIPSRLHSTRFPGKALAPINGVPLVVHVARRACGADVADETWVATDEPRIASAVTTACPGVRTWVDDTEYRSGSDRVAALVARRVPEADIILNVQGDEPLLTADVMRRAALALEGNDMGTVGVPIDDPSLLADPDTVKVTIDERGCARSFSRLDLGAGALAHVGIYSFSRGSLERFAALPSSRGERRERLEQLRALEQGMRIGVAEAAAQAVSVNRPRDVARVELLL